MQPLLILLALLGGSHHAPGWSIEASAEPSRLGPIEIRVDDPHRQSASRDLSIKQRLTFHNVGPREVRFEDTRTSKFALPNPPNRALVADEGCGYGLNRPGGRAVAGACRLYLDELRVGPGETESRSIAFSTGHPGMKALKPGTYTFRRPIRFQTGGRTVRSTLNMTYQVDGA